MAMLAVGYMLGRRDVRAGARRERVSRAPEVDPMARASGTQSEPPRSTAPPESDDDVPSPEPPPLFEALPPEQQPELAIPHPKGWHGEQFVHWYRSHAASYKLVRRSPEELRSFGAEVLEVLGCIPRREILDVLMVNYAALHEASRKVEADLHAGRISQREVEGRLAPARRLYSDRLYASLAYSDYRYLTREWADDKNPYRHFRHEQQPDTPRATGQDPYAIPLRSVEEFAAWYRAYRHDLKLPVRDNDFLDPFFNDIVSPLGRAPQPKLMRSLQRLYAAYRVEVSDGDSHGKAVRTLFRGLQAVLAPLDYERVRWWGDWSELLEEAGLAE